MSVYRAPEPPSVLPRPIQRRPQAAGAIRWLPRIFILPHVLAGLGMLAALVVVLANPLVGEETTAHITEERTSPVKGGYSYQVTYAYPHEGHTVQGTRSFSLGSRSEPSADERLAPGTPVTVRHVGVSWWRHDELLLPGESAWKTVLPVAFFAAFWNSITGVFLYLLWYTPWRNRNLVRWGTVAPGRIVKAYERKGKNTSYHVDYEFTMPGGTLHQGSMMVSSKDLWATVQEGQGVTVLRSPDGPKPSVVYEVSDYEWTRGGVL
jgi:hypothetical protein